MISAILTSLLISYDCPKTIADLDFKLFAKFQEKRQITALDDLRRELRLLKKLYEAKQIQDKFSK